MLYKKLLTALTCKCHNALALGSRLTNYLYIFLTPSMNVDFKIAMRLSSLNLEEVIGKIILDFV